jgi:hypothetical protein
LQQRRARQNRSDRSKAAGSYSFGYGRWDAPYWYLGKEPGRTGEGDAESWLRLGGGTELIDCAAHDNGPNGPLWHGPAAKLQPTWRPLIASLLAFKGAETYDSEAVRAYQDRSWGRLDGETAVLELLAAAAPDASTPTEGRLAHLDWRVEMLRLRIADHAPTFVICYGTGSDTGGGATWNTGSGLRASISCSVKRRS